MPPSPAGAQHQHAEHHHGALHLLHAHKAPAQRLRAKALADDLRRRPHQQRQRKAPLAPVQHGQQHAKRAQRLQPEHRAVPLAKRILHAERDAPQRLRPDHAAPAEIRQALRRAGERDHQQSRGRQRIGQRTGRAARQPRRHGQRRQHAQQRAAHRQLIGLCGEQRRQAAGKAPDHVVRQQVIRPRPEGAQQHAQHRQAGKRPLRKARAPQAGAQREQGQRRRRGHRRPVRGIHHSASPASAAAK